MKPPDISIVHGAGASFRPELCMSNGKRCGSTVAGTSSNARQGRHTDASIISHKIDFSVSHNDKEK